MGLSVLDSHWSFHGKGVVRTSNASVILGSGSEGIASETEGDQLSLDQMLCNLRTRMCCTAGTAKHMGGMMCLHVFMHHMQTRTGYLMCFLHLGGKARGILLMHLSVSTSYVEQRPAPLRPPASPSPLLP